MDESMRTAAAFVGKHKGKAVSELIDAIVAIDSAPPSTYLDGQRARIRAAIAILMGESYDGE